MKRMFASAALGSAFLMAVLAAPLVRADALPPGPVTYENPEALKGLKQVAIGSFTVDVLDKMEADTKVAGIELVAGLPSNISVTLMGVDRARYQALVDAMYDRFVADLAAQGVTVAPRESLAVEPDFATLESPVAHEEHSPAGVGRYLTAHGLPMYFVDETQVFPKMQIRLFGGKPERDPYINWTTAMGAGFAQAGYERQRSLARKLGMPVVNVRITMLGGMAHINKEFWRSGASAKTDAAMSFVPLYNRVLVVPAEGPMSRVALGQPVTTDKLGDLVNVTSGAGKAAETGLNTAIAASRFMSGFVPGGAILQHMNYTSHVAYEIRSDQPTFETAVTGGFATVSTTLTQPFAAR